MKGCITVLGSGTSQGIPVIACECSVCQSIDKRDNRSRASILISFNGENYCVDSGPDFRTQMLREKVKSLRGILFTHEHKDHISGMDDIRAFNYLEKRPMEVFASTRVLEALKREYHYIFSGNDYPGIPEIAIELIDNTPFVLGNHLKVVPFEVMHASMPVHAFRFGDFAYITDAKTISTKEKLKLKGIKTLIVNALRVPVHHSHFNLEEALEFINEIQPETTYLTHISHLFGTHEEILQLLPPNVFPAFDGLKFEFDAEICY